LTPSTSTARRKTPAKGKTKAKEAENSNGPGLFDVNTIPQRGGEGAIEWVPLEQIELALNPRKDMSREGLERLARMLMNSGQFQPAIGRRVADGKVIVYAGQRRFRAAELSHELAGTDGYDGLSPVNCLIVMLLDYVPTAADVRRIQSQENQREELSLADQAAAFADCWADRAGLPDADRIALVCADLGIDPKKAHNLRRCLTLPEDVRARVAERPTGDEISVTMANRLAGIHEISPELAVAVAARLTSRDLLDRATGDLGGFVHHTIVETADVYAVRLDVGALLDAHDEITRARPHLSEGDRTTLKAMFAAERAAKKLAAAAECEAAGEDPPKDDPGKRPPSVDAELDRLAGEASRGAVKVPVDVAMRERAVNGRFGWAHTRGKDYADSVWVTAPGFLIECAHAAVKVHSGELAKEESYFKSGAVADEDMSAARAEHEALRKAERLRQDQANTSNMTLGANIRGSLMELDGDQLAALRDMVCLIIARHYGDLVAFGAAWTDASHQQPVGDTKRYEPRAVDAILDSEVARALRDPDPLHGIASLMARLSAAFVLDPDGPTRSKALGTDRMTRQLRDALPGGAGELRSALWAFVRPMLTPRLAELNTPAFVIDPLRETIDIEAHRGDSSLEDLQLDDGD
jgi:hypothetical protein